MSDTQSTFFQSMQRFNEIVREIINSNSFSKNDLLPPLNAMRHLYRDELFSALENSGVVKFLSDATESHRSLIQSTKRFKISDNGFVQITTHDEDDLQITTPSFREIVEKNLLGRDHEMYWVAVVYLYMTAEEQILAHVVKTKIEGGLLK